MGGESTIDFIFYLGGGSFFLYIISEIMCGLSFICLCQSFFIHTKIFMSWFAFPDGDLDLDNLNGKKSYHQITAYIQSKIANIMFALELSALLKGMEKILPFLLKT